jgi:hypothetical protein
MSRMKFKSTKPDFALFLGPWRVHNVHRMTLLNKKHPRGMGGLVIFPKIQGTDDQLHLI